MIIGHNVAAKRTLNYLSENTSATKDALDKLSSGLKINKAADDAAGLAISEKMKAQIDGLNQAKVNINEGISLAQTADSALGNIANNCLLRLRSLALQASNGTLSTQDREKLQDEVCQTLDGINEIAESTKFNQINLLSKPKPTMNLSVLSGKADIVFIVDSTGSMGSAIDNVKENIDAFSDELKDNGVDARFGLVDFKDVTEADPIKKYDFGDESAFISEVNGMSAGGGGDEPESGLDAIADPTNGGLSFSFRSDATKQFVLVTDAHVHDAISDGGDGGSSYSIPSIINSLTSSGIALNVVGSPYSSIMSQLDRLSSSTGGQYLNIYGDFASQLDNLADDISDSTGSVTGTRKVILQVGPSSKDTFKIRLVDATTKSLRIDNISVNTVESAQSAISKIDAATDRVIDMRTQFGTSQITLNFLGSNVDSTGLNLNSADSVIEDADMAKEMLKYTKSNILVQSSQAMFAQANQLPQGILSLLK